MVVDMKGSPWTSALNETNAFSLVANWFYCFISLLSNVATCAKMRMQRASAIREIHISLCRTSVRWMKEISSIFNIPLMEMKFNLLSISPKHRYLFTYAHACIIYYQNAYTRTRVNAQACTFALFDVIVYSTLQRRKIVVQTVKLFMARLL